MTSGVRGMQVVSTSPNNVYEILKQSQLRSDDDLSMSLARAIVGRINGKPLFQWSRMRVVGLAEQYIGVVRAMREQLARLNVMVAPENHVLMFEIIQAVDNGIPLESMVDLIRNALSGPSQSTPKTNPPGKRTPRKNPPRKRAPREKTGRFNRDNVVRPGGGAVKPVPPTPIAQGDIKQKNSLFSGANETMFMSQGATETIFSDESDSGDSDVSISETETKPTASSTDSAPSAGEPPKNGVPDSKLRPVEHSGALPATVPTRCGSHAPEKKAGDRPQPAPSSSSAPGRTAAPFRCPSRIWAEHKKNLQAVVESLSRCAQSLDACSQGKLSPFATIEMPDACKRLLEVECSSMGVVMDRTRQLAVEMPSQMQEHVKVMKVALVSLGSCISLLNSYTQLNRVDPKISELLHSHLRSMESILGNATTLGATMNVA